MYSERTGAEATWWDTELRRSHVMGYRAPWKTKPMSVDRRTRASDGAISWSECLSKHHTDNRTSVIRLIRLKPSAASDFISGTWLHKDDVSERSTLMNGNREFSQTHRPLPSVYAYMNCQSHQSRDWQVASFSAAMSRLSCKKSDYKGLCLIINSFESEQSRLDNSASADEKNSNKEILWHHDIVRRTNTTQNLQMTSGLCCAHTQWKTHRYWLNKERRIGTDYTTKDVPVLELQREQKTVPGNPDTYSRSRSRSRFYFEESFGYTCKKIFAWILKKMRQFIAKMGNFTTM